MMPTSWGHYAEWVNQCMGNLACGRWRIPLAKETNWLASGPARNQSCQSPSPSLFCLNLISQWARHGDLLWSELHNWRGAGSSSHPAVGRGPFWWLLMLLLLPTWQLYIQTPEVWGKLSFPLCSAFSNSLWPNGPKPTRLLYPWFFSGKNTAVGCHFFLHLSLSLYQSYKLYPLALDQNSLHF